MGARMGRDETRETELGKATRTRGPFHLHPQAFVTEFFNKKIAFVTYFFFKIENKNAILFY
jgi:hypothetical protein